MELIKFTLCPLCTECPEVEITDEGGQDRRGRKTPSDFLTPNGMALIKRGDLHEV